MEQKLCIINIVISDRNSAAAVNTLLHEYGEYIIGRMGIPYGERKISVICIVLDAPSDKVSALSGKLGMITGVSAKTVIAKLPEKSEK